MQDTVFDYFETAKREGISQDILDSILKDATIEFPDDDMMRELHIVRAIKFYSKKKEQVAS